MNTIKHTVLNSHSRFTQEQIAKIDKACGSAVNVLDELFPNHTPVDIVFYDNASEVNVALGVGGQTINESLIFMPLDSQFDFSEQEVFVTICHEFHHKIRLEAFGPMYTLFESVIAEGLAEQFEKELLPDRTLVTYSEASDVKQIEQSLHDLKEVLDGGEYDYYEWFSGTGKYPKWYGYTLGNFIINKYMEKYHKKPSELARTPLNSFEKFITSLSF
jgi:uncharacterized protein YjaZ